MFTFYTLEKYQNDYESCQTNKQTNTSNKMYCTWNINMTYMKNFMNDV